MKSLKNKMGKMAIVACLIGAIVLVWGRKEIVNEKFAKNEKVIATQTIEIQENERLHLSVGAVGGQTIFWSPSLKVNPIKRHSPRFCTDPQKLDLKI